MTTFAHVIPYTDPTSPVQAVVVGLKSRHPFADVELLEEALDNKSIIGTVLVDGLSHGLLDGERFALIDFNGFRCDRQSARFIDPSSLDDGIKDKLTDFYTDQPHVIADNVILTSTQRTALLQGSGF